MLDKSRRLLNLTGSMTGHRLHRLPLLVLYLTDGCNSRCITCDIWRSPRRNMSPALVDQIVPACAELGVRWVLLSGGEAMQHPDWPGIAARLRAAGAHVMLLTNGLLLRRQIDAVLESVDEVIVSLDGGTAATYAAIRGVDGFDLVLEGIAAVRAGGLPVTTRTTIQRANYAEMPQIIDAARAAGADHISFLAVDIHSAEAFGPRPLEDQSAALSPAEIDHFAAVLDAVIANYAADFASGLLAEPPDKLRRLLDYFRAVDNTADYPRPRCNAPHISTVIEVDGRVRPCYFLPVYGRMRPGDALGTIINGDAALALRRAYQAGERAECGRCVCPLYRGPRALLRM